MVPPGFTFTWSLCSNLSSTLSETWHDKTPRIFEADYVTSGSELDSIMYVHLMERTYHILRLVDMVSMFQRLLLPGQMRLFVDMGL